MLGAAFLLFVAALGLCLRPAPSPDDLPLQHATGGFGLGPATAVDWSFFTYDARAESGCEAELWPIPGAPCYVPHHGAALADLPPLDRR